jgi:tight adherence protein C
MIILAALVIAASVFVLAYTLLTPSQARPVTERLDRFDRSSMSERDAKLAQPFSKRVVSPVGATMRRIAAAMLPSSIVQYLDKKLLVAGNPLTLQAFLTFQSAAVGGAVVLALFHISNGPSGVLLIGGLLGCVLLAVAPLYWLRLRVASRKRAILKALPDAVDLVVTTVEAGMSIDGALAEVGQETRGPLGEELKLAIRETALGRSRREALLRMVDRTDVPDLRTFIQSIVQAEQTGIPVGQVLRTQAEQIRLKKRQRAEAEAQRAPVKMIVVLVTMVLPSMLMMVMGPALIRMSDSL